MSTMFKGAQSKLSIASLEESFTHLVVHAQYNPKELQVAQPIGWTEREPPPVSPRPTSTRSSAA